MVAISTQPCHAQGMKPPPVDLTRNQGDGRLRWVVGVFWLAGSCRIVAAPGLLKMTPRLHGRLIDVEYLTPVCRLSHAAWRVPRRLF